MPSSLRAELDALAARFAEQIMAVIASASLDDLLDPGGGTRAGGGRAAPALNAKVAAVAPARLPRRSEEEIAKALGKVVLLLKTRKDGMRAEDIRAAFGLLPREMPRILKQGLAGKKLSAKGRKRATKYFAG